LIASVLRPRMVSWWIRAPALPELSIRAGLPGSRRGGRFCEDAPMPGEVHIFSRPRPTATMNTTAMGAPESTLVRSPQSRHQCGEFMPGAKRSRFGSGWQAYRFFP
jgi:hypothetical protein